MNADNSADQDPRLVKQFEQYLETLHTMAQTDPRFSVLTKNDIRASWMNIPIQEQRGILLLAQLQQFFSKITSESSNEQRKTIERDINRKGKDSKFGEYTRKLVDIYDQMQHDGELLGSWYYISQARKTELEEHLDSSGVDWVLQKSDGIYILVQSGTRPGDARDHMRHLDDFYGPKFAAFRFIGTIPILDDFKNIPSDDILKNRVRSVMSSTRGFTSDLLSSAFPPGGSGTFRR